MNKEIWIESLGRIELEMTMEQAKLVPLSGDVEHGVCLLSKQHDVLIQLSQYTPELIAKCLLEFGAWNEEQLKDEKANILRLLWVAASDIQTDAELEENIHIEPHRIW